MSLRNRFVLVLVAVTLAVLLGCGSGAHNPVPPPSGGFSDTDFNGTYTFSVSGQDANGIFAMAGSLVACGCSAGTISSGTVGLEDITGAAPGSTIGSNSTYSISTDGRGSARLMITTTAGALEVDLDFVLTSSSHGLIIRYDDNGTGSGTIDLQPNAVSLAATTYSFMLTGSDLSNAPLATAGAFTLNSSGGITAGVEDFNYKAVPSIALALAGSIGAGSGTTPGSASFTTAFSATPFTFDVYAIDATHLKLVETDGQAVLVGDVFTQAGTASIPTGNLVFTMSGLDTNGNVIAMGGLMSSDGSVISNGSEDVNDAGTVDGGTSPATPYSFSGTFGAVAGGRFPVTLTGFSGGTNFAAYPSSGGLLMLEIDSGLNAGVASGVALAQAANPSVSASAGYGLNLTGEDVVNLVELDEIAEFQTTSSSFTSGLLDENDGSPSNAQNFGGSYTVGSNGSGSATNLSSGLASMFFYVADSSTVLFISTDPSEAALGSFQIQTTPQAARASPAAQPRPLPMLRVMPHGRLASRRDKTGAGFAK
jgi:hypothetical protein